jgi:hypothetical protein
MLLTIILIIVYLCMGVYWLNKIGKEGGIYNALQSITILLLWPITYILRK